MKIAYIIGGLPFGGIENWLYDLCLKLKGRENVGAVVLNVSGTGVKIEDYQKAGIELINVCDSKKTLKTFRLDTALKVRRLLKDIRPDLIHTLQFSGDYFGRLASLGLGIPVITHIRNIKRENKKHRVLANRLLSYATDLYISVSKQALATIEKQHNMAGREVKVLYNAVNPAKLDGPGLDMKQAFGLEGKIVLGVGRMVAQKNFDLLIRAFRKVLDRYQGKAGLLIAGDGGERERLQTLISQLGIADKAMLAGYRTDIPALMRSSHILAMPSDYEGLPVTHVEAMFCGLPAVISRHVPSIEIASESSLVCKRTPEDIADKLLALLEDGKLYTDMSARALEASRLHTMDLHVEKLMAIYDEVLKGRTHG